MEFPIVSNCCCVFVFCLFVCFGGFFVVVFLSYFAVVVWSFILFRVFFHVFFSNFNRIFCKQTLEIMIRRRERSV